MFFRDKCSVTVAPISRSDLHALDEIAEIYIPIALVNLTTIVLSTTDSPSGNMYSQISCTIYGHLNIKRLECRVFIAGAKSLFIYALLNPALSAEHEL